MNWHNLQYMSADPLNSVSVPVDIVGSVHVKNIDGHSVQYLSSVGLLDLKDSLFFVETEVSGQARSEVLQIVRIVIHILWVVNKLSN